MVTWDSLIDADELAGLLPAQYAHFAQPIKEALAFFLDRLSPEQQGEILLEQSELPATASVAQRLTALASKCPVLHKLGQILARDQRLAVELRDQLQQLESMPPTVSEATTRRLLADALGPLEHHGLVLLPPAIAEASVALVVRFVQIRGQRRHGVFKVLKPGIVDRLQQELELAWQVGDYLDQRCNELGIPAFEYRETFEKVQEKLRWEVQLDQEQRHLAQASRFYAADPSVQIPTLYPRWSTPQVTAMEFIEGDKITDHSLDAFSDKRRLAELTIEALIARPIFSPDAKALFHCDPHAGNLFFTKDQRLAILDWSLTGTLTEIERIAIVQIMFGAVTLNGRQIAQVLTELSERPPLQQPLRETIEAWLRRIRQGQLPGLAWLIGLMDEAVEKGRIRLGADLLMFRKTLHTLEGVLSDLVHNRQPDAANSAAARSSPMDGVVLVEFLKNFVAELPRRWTASPGSRDFATRVSNLDLTRWMLQSPATASRFWLGQVGDRLAARRPESGSP